MDTFTNLALVSKSILGVARTSAELCLASLVKSMVSVADVAFHAAIFSSYVIVAIADLVFHLRMPDDCL